MYTFRDPYTGKTYRGCDYTHKYCRQYLARAVSVVTVSYNHVTSDTLALCAPCAREVATDSRRQRYKVTVRPLREP